MRLILALTVFIACQVAAQAQLPVFDGICRLSVDGKQWSGVAISQTEILTVAHHGETENIRAEFPESTHGEFNHLGIRCRVIKSNVKADLSLLQYNCPSYAAIAHYPVSRKEFKRVEIKGYVRSSPMALICPVAAQDRQVDGYTVLTLQGAATAGMSGSAVLSDRSVVGIQFGGSETVIDAVTAETIHNFLDGR